MYLVRGDLDDNELTALESQFPDLIARVRAARPACGGGPGDGVQPLHLVSEAAVDR
jgi:hypothetical protein